jgi:hypothetical protein
MPLLVSSETETEKIQAAKVSAQGAQLESWPYLPRLPEWADSSKLPGCHPDLRLCFSERTQQTTNKRQEEGVVRQLATAAWATIATEATRRPKTSVATCLRSAP